MIFKRWTKTQKRILLSLAIAVTANLTGAAILFLDREAVKSIHSLERREPGQGDYEETLSVQLQGEKGAEEVTVQVKEKFYGQQEALQLLEEARNGLELLTAGKNESLDKVESGLYLPESYPDIPVRLMFWTDRPEILDSQGNIGMREQDKPEEVMLFCELSLCGENIRWERKVKVYPPKLTKKQKLESQIAKSMEESNGEGTEPAHLPDKVDGKTITFFQKGDSSGPAVCVLGTLAGFMILPLYREKEKKKEENRKQCLQKDYPELLTRLLLFLKAGMTVRNAFRKIAAEYEVYGKKLSPVNHPAYEEVKKVCRLLDNGLPEEKAYGEFGDRCGLPEYKVLSVLLVQNLKKGGPGVLFALEKEAVCAREEQKRRSRIQGEQAAAKLLLPMMMQLTVVLVIVMFPAFASLG